MHLDVLLICVSCAPQPGKQWKQESMARSCKIPLHCTTWLSFSECDCHLSMAIA